MLLIAVVVDLGIVGVQMRVAPDEDLLWIEFVIQALVAGLAALFVLSVRRWKVRLTRAPAGRLIRVDRHHFWERRESGLAVFLRARLADRQRPGLFLNMRLHEGVKLAEGLEHLAVGREERRKVPRSLRRRRRWW